MWACVSRIALHLDVEVADGAEQLVDLVAGIDDHRLARPLAADDEAVLVEGRHRPRLRESFTVQSY